MHSVLLLHRWLKKSCPWIHVARVGVLVKVVEGLLGGGRLALTHLGRSLQSKAYVKHNIKCVDRLLGNEHLHRERRVARTLEKQLPRSTELLPGSGR